MSLGFVVVFFCLSVLCNGPAPTAPDTSSRDAFRLFCCWLYLYFLYHQLYVLSCVICFVFVIVCVIVYVSFCTVYCYMLFSDVSVIIVICYCFLCY